MCRRPVCSGGFKLAICLFNHALLSIIAMLDSAAFMIICIMIFTYLHRRLQIPNGRPPLPPGPSVISLIGQALRASPSTGESVYSRWAHEYGDIVHVSMLNRHVIIINSAQMAVDMLDSKGSAYSNRELTPMLKLSGWSDVLPATQPGAFFKQQRTYMHKLFGTQAALSSQYNVIEDESHRFLEKVLSSPDDLADCIRDFSGSIALKISYGYTTKDKDDPLIFSAEKVLQEFSAIMNFDSLPWMVDLFPSLEKLPSWFPGTHFKKLAKEWSNDLQEFTDTPFQLVKEQMVAGTAIPSFTSTILSDEDISPKDEYAIKMASMAIYGGGSDTTVSTIRGFYLAMALNPAVLKKAQEELDAIVGAQRLPSILDRTRLPYVNALILEVHRWNVVMPYGAPHQTSRDDVHAGYFIPKGSLVLQNTQFIMNDHRLYKDPEQFIPERFLRKNPEKDPRGVVFGLGRRICPGRFLADDTVFIVCAMSIAVFDIRKKVKNGAVVEPVRGMEPGFISHPKPYEIEVKPRSAQATALIHAAAEA